MTVHKHKRKGTRLLLTGLPLLVVLILTSIWTSGSAAGVSLGAQTGVADVAGKIEPKVIEDTAGGAVGSFIVLMANQADVSSAYTMKDQDARGWHVYTTLRDHAIKTQGSIRATLDALRVSYKSLWAVNALVVSGDRTLVDALAARPDVRKIESDRPSKGVNPMVELTSEMLASPAFAAGVEWGVNRVRATELWAMGYKGQGIVVANQDTGMRWTHNAIKSKYRGWNGATADHNYNWWDSIRVPSPNNVCGNSTSQPCDDDTIIGGGHGTHTTGTIVGDDGLTNQVGVAPAAKWIGCRNMDRGVGRPSTYAECFQFFLAPTDLNGQNADPARRPHVMNNSWGCVEGCAPDTLKTAVENSQASGIFVVASAGNDGSNCSTAAFTPSIFDASFTVGSINSSNVLAGSSSRGPVISDLSNRMKPNISAPGVTVRSALRASDTTYGNLSGTSMAGPHVVGAVALLWSARPDLAREIQLTKDLLQQTANPNVVVTPAQTCGGTASSQIPNNSFGHGRVDVAAALQRAQATIPTQPVCDTGIEYKAVESTGPSETHTDALPVVGSQCDDCTVKIELPFPFYFYGQPFTSVNASSNGNLQFSSNDPGYHYDPRHLCHPLPVASMNNAIFAFWRDLDMRTTTWPTNGIYTISRGSAPNRVFIIEWRSCIFASGYCGGGRADFEVWLYERDNEVVVRYNNVTYDNWPAAVGAQKGTGSEYTQFTCAAHHFPRGTRVTFVEQCKVPTSTPTHTPTNTPTSTPTYTSTPLPTDTPVPSETATAPPPTATNTPVPTHTSVPTNTSTATATPPPCNVCGMEVTQVTTTCNLDGTVRWSATVHNKNECTAVNGWKAELQVKRGSGGFVAATSLTGTGTFPPGYSVVSGDLCYGFTPDITSMRVEAALDTTNARCSPHKKSEGTVPCNNPGGCR